MCFAYSIEGMARADSSLHSCFLSLVGPHCPCFVLSDSLWQEYSLFDHQIPLGMGGPLLVLWASSRSFGAVVLYF